MTNNFYKVNKQKKISNLLIKNERIEIFNKLNEQLDQCIGDCVQHFYKSIFSKIFKLKQSNLLNHGINFVNNLTY